MRSFVRAVMLLLFSVWVPYASAALLTYTVEADNSSSSPMTFNGVAGNAYNDGPHKAAAANFGAVLRDSGGDGASFTYTLTNFVAGVPIAGLTLTGSCSMAAGSPGSTGCGIGASAFSTSTSLAVNAGSSVLRLAQFTLSGFDTLAATGFTVLSGGPGASEQFGQSFGAQNTSSSEMTFNAVVGGGTTAGSHASASSDFIATLMDVGGDGVTLTFTLDTFIGGVLIPALTIAGTCSFSGAALAAGGCAPGATLGATTAAFDSPAAGNLLTLIDLTVSGGDSVAGVGALRLFNAATNAVSEPNGTPLLLWSLLVLWMLRRTESTCVCRQAGFAVTRRSRRGLV